MAYTNTLYLTLSFSYGTTEELSVDLTDTITDALAGNQGVLPDGTTLPVELSRTVIGLGATVGDWSVGGEGEKELQ